MILENNCNDVCNRHRLTFVPVSCCIRPLEQLAS